MTTMIRMRAVLAHTAVVLGLGMAAACAHAAPVWQQTDNLQSTLDSSIPWTYSSDPGTRTGVVTFQNQVATNVGATAERMGMYIAWNWSYDGSGNETALSWSNTDQVFFGGGVRMKVQYVGMPDQFLRIGDVVGDTWIGNPWPVGYPGAIATEADWTVPFFDLGQIAAGTSVTYGLRVTMVFDSDAAFEDWDAGGNMGIYGQGVQAMAVPEPASLALVALALAAAGLARRRRR